MGIERDGLSHRPFHLLIFWSKSLPGEPLMEESPLSPAPSFRIMEA